MIEKWDYFKNKGDKIMLGLAILFGLFVWIVVTLIATIIGYKIGKAAHYPKMGALTGFMLTMGGWIVYWIIEYQYIQAKVSHLCEKEAGITVYVTPEQWRKQIGEEEWKKLKPYSKNEQNKFDRKRKIFDGIEFIPIAQVNKYVLMYSGGGNMHEFISKDIGILVDMRNQNILVKYVSIYAGAGIWVSDGSPKFWLNNLKDYSYVREEGQTVVTDQYSNLLLGDRHE